MVSSPDNRNTKSYVVSLLGTRGFPNVISLRPPCSLQGPQFTRDLELREGTALAQVTQLVKAKRCPHSRTSLHTHAAGLAAARDPECMFWGQEIVRNMCTFQGSPDRRESV